MEKIETHVWAKNELYLIETIYMLDCEWSDKFPIVYSKWRQSKFSNWVYYIFNLYWWIKYF